MNRFSRPIAILLGAILAAILVVTTSCEMSFQTSLYQSLSDAIDAERAVLQPDIAIFEGDVYLADGAVTDGFAGAVQGIERRVTFTIRNLGDGNLELTEEPVEVTTLDSGLDLGNTPPSKMVIQPGDEAKFEVTATFMEGGEKTFQINVSSNDPDEDTYVIVGSNELIPSIQVQASGTTVSDGATVDFDDAEYLVGTSSQTITILNLGTADLELLSWDLASVADFSTSSPGATVIEPGGSTTIGVEFGGSLPGQRETELVLESNDSLRSTQTFTLSGSCYLPVQESFISITEHGLARTDDGDVWSWGSNRYGQLGMGSTDSDPHPLPATISGLDNVVAVSAGRWHSLALLEDGTVQSWGRNYYRSLGDGEGGFYRATPGPVSVLTDVVAISAGDSHNLALRNDGTVWAWGRNVEGQIGDASNDTAEVPVQVTGGFDRVVRIDAGGYHSAAVDTNGDVWMWGSGAEGKLGNGGVSDSNVPVHVDGLTVEISDIDAGGRHTLALDSDGGMWAWGANDSSQIGVLVAGDHLVPVSVDNGGTADAVAVSAGYEHSIAMDADGQFWGWGMGYYGELGMDIHLFQSTPELNPTLSGVMEIDAGSNATVVLCDDGRLLSFGTGEDGRTGDGTTGDRYMPVPVGRGFAGVTKVVSGGGHTLALEADGTVWSWGDNDYGQLGLGGQPTVPTQISALSNIVDISAGQHHSLALDGDGDIYGWGSNLYGQMGNPVMTMGNYSTPVEAAPGISGTVVALGSGDSHCFAITKGGALWAWGSNYWGQLGDDLGSVDDPPANKSDSPVLVPGLSAVSVQEAVGGRGHTIVLDSDGNIWTWGLNDQGQLGDNSRTRRTVPLVVSGVSGVTDIAAGYLHSLAVAGGNVWAWGNNSDGVSFNELGNGGTTDQLSPVMLATISGVVHVSANYNHSLAVKTDGTVWAWGASWYGQLGIPGTTGETSPAQVGPLVTAADISAGYFTTHVLTAEGTVWACGRNDLAQLGEGSWTHRNTLGMVSPLRLW